MLHFRKGPTPYTRLVDSGKTSLFLFVYGYGLPLVTQNEFLIKIGHNSKSEF